MIGVMKNEAIAKNWVAMVFGLFAYILVFWLASAFLVTGLVYVFTRG